MKRLFLLTAAPLLLFAAGCQKEPTGPFTLGIDLTGDFNHNYVVVQVDGVIQFQDSLTTNHRISSDAHSTRSQQAKGAHTIIISVDKTSDTISVDLKRDQYIAIGYYQQTAQFTVQYSDQPYLYQ